MGTYGKGSKCDKLWCVWHGLLIAALHLFLIYNGITRYLFHKFLAFDPKFGGDWDQAGLNFSLAMLIGAIGSFCLFLFVSIIRTTNYANESIQIGRDMNSINVLSVAQTWRSSIPLTSMPPTLMNSRPCATGSVVNGGLIQRPHFTTLSGGSEDERASVLAGEETLTAGGIYDTWPRRGAMNHDAVNPYNAMNMLHCIQDQEAQSYLSIRKSCCLLWQQMQRHFLPYASMLHLLAAYCLLLPIPIVQAQQIYHGALDFGWIWRSDLDFIFGCSPITERQPVHSGGAQVVGSLVSSIEDHDTSDWENLRAFSPEFFNLALVFILLVLRYPGVFWYTNRSFSFLFSLLIFLTGVNVLIEHSAASVLVKFAWNAHSFPHIPSVRLLSAPKNLPASVSSRGTVVKTSADEANLDMDRPPSPSALESAGPLFLSTVGALFFLLLFLTVFEYGYHQFLDNLAAYRMYLMDATGTHGDAQTVGANLIDRYNGGGLQNSPGPVYNPSDSGQSGLNESGKFNPCFNGASFLGRKSTSCGLGAELLHPATRCCLFTYSPHLWAMIGSLCVLAIKFPLIWDCIQIYRVTKCALLLASPLSGIVLFCTWFIVWFAFGLKPAWKFQVSFPVHTISGPVIHSESGMLSHFQPPVNGSILSPVLMGTSPTGPPNVFGNRSDPMNHLFTSQGPLPNVGPLTPRANCFTQEDGPVAHTTGIPSSPTYACFHGSYQGAIPGATGRGVRFVTNIEPTMAFTAANGLSPSPVGGAANHEHCAEDTEAGSSKQSGSNYVCLHSSFASPGWDTSTTPAILVPTDCGGVFPQLSQPGPQCVARMPSSSLPNRPQVSFGCTEISVPGVTVATANVISSISPEHEPRSSNITYSVAVHHPGEQDSTTYQSNSLRPCNLLVDCPPTQTTQGALSALNHLQPPTAAHQSPANDLFCNSAYDRSQSIVNSPSTRPIYTVVANPCGQRVTFRRNVELITGVSPAVSDLGSQNNSSDDSGIDNLKMEHQNPISSEPPLTNKPFGSGPYDNAFPMSLCSSTGVHRLNQDPQMSQETIAISSMTGTSMNDSIYSTHISTFTSNPSERPCPSQSVLTESALRNMLVSTSEMIGDANNNYQCSTSEHFPLLLCQELLVDKNHETRLCSQV